MFAATYFAPRYFAPRYFPKVGADPDPVTGGPVWVWVNGTAFPPANQAVGVTRYWMWVNGTVYVPPQGGRPAIPRNREKR